MKKLFLIILSICCFGMAYGNKIEDRYVMRPLDKGQLYFIVPFDLPAWNAKTKEMSIDITYLTSSDSITMNMSVWSANELMTDSIVYVGEKRLVIRDFQTFFIEKDNKLWLHRYSVRLPFSDLALLYAGTKPYQIIFYDRSNRLQYEYALKQWEKEKNWMNQIIHIIITNKRIYK